MSNLIDLRKTTRGQIKVGVSNWAFYHQIKNKFPFSKVVSPNEDDIKKYDLIVFTGGSDIYPGLYNQFITHACVNEQSIKRDKVERQIFYISYRLNKKIVGICRGHQLINALLGGELVQDLHLDLNKSHFAVHPLMFNIHIKDSIIRRFFRTVNSLHHQGVIKTGEGLTGTSFHKEVCESTESKNIISVQFHPEMMHGEQTESFWDFISLWANPSIDESRIIFPGEYYDN